MKKSYYYLSEKLITKVSVNLILLFIITSISSFSCNDSSYDVDDPCGCDSETIARHEDVEGTIVRFKDSFLIKLRISDGFISVKPCGELEDKFKNEGIKVVVIGDLKKNCEEGAPNLRIGGGHPYVIEKIEALPLQN